MPLSLENIQKAKDAGYDDEQIIQSIEKKDPEFAKRISRARQSGYGSSDIMSSIQRRLSSEQSNVVKNDPGKSKKQDYNYKDFFSKGLLHSSTGELATLNDQTTSEIERDPNFWESLVYQGGEITGDLPWLLAGGSLGASLGGTAGSYAGPFGAGAGALIGGGAGALALPTFLKEALREYKDYSSKGNDLTFGEFLQRADKVGSETIKSGILGATLGIVSKAAPVLERIPGIGKLFSTKLGSKAGTIGAEAATAASVPAISEGRLPSAEEFASALAVIAGFNIAKLPRLERVKILKAARDSGLTPEEFAESPLAKEIISEAKAIEANPEVKPEIKPEVKPESKEFQVQEGRNGAFYPEKIELTKEEKQLVDASNSWDKAGDRAEASKYAQEARELIYKRISPKEKQTPKPIIETTGKSAADQLESPPTKLSKIKQAAETVKNAINNPTETANRLYAKTFDALEPLNKYEAGLTTDEKASTRIKQAQSAASDVNNVLTQGIFDNVSNKFDNAASLKQVYEGNIWKKLSKGLKEGEYSVQEFDEYRTSREALKRQERGLKSGIDTSVAKQDVSKLKSKYGPIEQRLREYQSKTLEHYGKDLLDNQTREQWKQDAHASLYRVMDYGSDAVVSEGSLAPKKPWYKAKGSTRKILPPSESDIQNTSMLITNSKKNDSVVQYKKLVEQGKLPGKIVKSKNKEMPSNMMEDLDISEDAKELAENLYNQSRKDAFTPQKNRLKGWENGKPFEIEVPEDVYEVYSSQAPTDTGFFTNIFKFTNNLMSKGIVLEPRKMISIFGRDALGSLIYSKTGSNPISIARALSDIYKGTEEYKKFKALGGEQYASRLMTRAERTAKVDDLIKQSGGKKLPFNGLADFLSNLSSNISAAVPFAEYQRAVKKFGDTPEGRLMALIESKSVTYDPTKKGSSQLVKGAANFLPFFNVMLQEPAMIAKNLKRPEFVAKGLAYLTMPSLLLHMYNEGNPDYDDMNPILKASCWHFYTDDGHYACPIPWLLGATFKAAPEAMYDYLRNKGSDSFKGLYSYVASQLSGSFPPLLQAVVEQSTGESLPNPAALAAMPFVDVEKRAPPVVPKRLQNLPPEQQYTSKTSQLARWFGQMWGASPVKVERLVKTFGGNIASDMLALVDEMAYVSGLAEDKRPEQRAKNYLLLGNFLSENTPTNTKYTSQFYDLLENARLDRKREQPNNLKSLLTYNKKISTKLKMYRDIEESSINPREKRQQLVELQKQINSLYKEAVLKHNQG